jgi:hypothetical protein
MKVTFADGTGRDWTYGASFEVRISTQVVFYGTPRPGDTVESPPSPALLEFTLVRTSQPVVALDERREPRDLSYDIAVAYLSLSAIGCKQVSGGFAIV